MLTGNERPLIYDTSSHQKFVDASILESNRAVGIYSRAGVGYVADKIFDATRKSVEATNMWFTSYWALWPSLDVRRQIFQWNSMHVREYIPRVIDFEAQTSDAKNDALALLEMSEAVASKDNAAPWIYTRVNILDRVREYLPRSFFFTHFFILAQYRFTSWIEHPGPPYIPAWIPENRVIMHQTSSHKRPPAGAVGSTALDTDRWCWPDMHGFLAQEYGSGDNAPPPPNICSIEGRVESEWMYVRSGPSTKYGIVGRLERGEKVSVLGIYGNDAWARIGPNRYAAIYYHGKRYIDISVEEAKSK